MNLRKLTFGFTLVVAMGMSIIPVHGQSLNPPIKLESLSYTPAQVENAANSGSSFNSPIGSTFEVYYWDEQQKSWVWARFAGNGMCQNLPVHVADRVTQLRLVNSTTPGVLQWFIDADCGKAVLKIDYPVQVQPTAQPVTPTTVLPTAIPLSTALVPTTTQMVNIAGDTAQPVQPNQLDIHLCGTGWPRMVVYRSGGVLMVVPDDQHQNTTQTFRITSLRLLGGNRLLQFTYVGKVTPGPC